MGKKKIIGLIGLFVIVLGIGIASGITIASHNQPAVKKQSNNKHSSETGKKHHKKSESKSSSNNSAKTANEKFDDLPQNTQIALLVNHHAIINNMTPHTNTHYSLYAGAPNKMVIHNDGEGGGAVVDPDHTMLINDNHDGSFTYATPKTSATSLMMADASNSWWENYATTQKAALLKEYSSSKDTVDEIASEVDLSMSSESFRYYVSVNQTTKPATTDDGTDDIDSDDYDSDDGTDYDDTDDEEQSDDDYYVRKAREPNADWYLVDGTHMHNDDQGNSYNVDTGELIGKGD